MDNNKALTLCELIDKIVTESKAIGNKANISNELVELSTRLDLSRTSTLLFSNIFYKSLRGEFPSKAEIITCIQDENSKEIYLALQDLFKKELVKCFRTHPRQPVICFYTLDELDKKIINNEIPSINRKPTAINKSSINIKPKCNSSDHLIYLADVQIGIIYFKLSEIYNFTAIVNDSLAAEADTLNEIENRLNKMLNDKDFKLD